MNVVFTMDDPEKEAMFMKMCKEQGFYGVKGHRSVGGFRMSLYNALSMSSVEAAVALLREFAQKMG